MLDREIALEFAEHRRALEGGLARSPPSIRERWG